MTAVSLVLSVGTEFDGVLTGFGAKRITKEDISWVIKTNNVKNTATEDMPTTSRINPWVIGVLSIMVPA